MSNNTSSNRAAVPEAKGALNRFKYEECQSIRCTSYRWIQRKPDFQTEWFCRWIYGKKND